MSDVAVAEPRPPRLGVILRQAREGDEGLIYNSWLKTLRAQPHFAAMPAEHYYRAQHCLIDHLLSRPHTVVIVAMPDTEGSTEDDLAGYVVAGPGRRLVHWVYVKDAYRGQGVAGQLLRGVVGTLGAGDILCSHWTHGARWLAQRYPLRYYPGGLR